jgi:dTDP-4-dehydrorhamnose 3,5-epimerase
MSRFDFIDTPINGLKILQRKPIGDSRGYLERLFCSEELQPLLNERRIVQINRTFTARRGTVRGMHFQLPPHAETKLVSCLRGKVFDVAVDIRRGSPSFLRWHAQELSPENCKMMFIPEGFAHGLQTLSDDCELLYLHTASFSSKSEDGLNPRDPLLGIRWPNPISDVSERDAGHSMLTDSFTGVAV